MPLLLTCALAAVIATNQPSAVTNVVREKSGTRVEASNLNDPVDREYLSLLLADEAAQKEVERWIAEESRLTALGAGDGSATLRLRTRQRFAPVEKAYKDFLERNPKHVKARIAFGSFLGDIGREDEGAQQYIKAREIDPKNPAPWNNLANYYGHNSPVTNAFVCYEKAIELDPNEPVYLRNFATTVYLFRRDATNHFKIPEQQVFDKAMGLYRRALALEPGNFEFATDLAQTYYGIQPPRVADALKAWNDAMKLARDDGEREGIRLHLARWHRTAGDKEAARRELGLVTNQVYVVMRDRILKSLEAKTNAVSGAPVSNPAR